MFVLAAGLSLGLLSCLFIAQNASGQFILADDGLSGVLNNATIDLSTRVIDVAPPPPPPGAGASDPVFRTDANGFSRLFGRLRWVGDNGFVPQLPTVGNFPAVGDPDRFFFRATGPIGPATVTFAFGGPPVVQNFGPGSLAILANNTGIRQGFVSLSDQHDPNGTEYASVIDVFANASYKTLIRVQST